MCAVLALALSACGGDGDEVTTTTGAHHHRGTDVDRPGHRGSGHHHAPTSAVPPTTASGVSIDVVVTDDGIDAEDRYDVPLGEEVTITVTSTFADEVHVHSYDLFAELEPDVPGRITFVADVPGVFEVELENAGVPLFELVVE